MRHVLTFAGLHCPFTCSHLRLFYKFELAVWLLMLLTMHFSSILWLHVSSRLKQTVKPNYESLKLTPEYIEWI